MSIDLTSSTITKSAKSFEIWKGQSLDIELEVVKEQTQPDGNVIEVPEDLTGATVKFTVRREASNPEVIISKTSASSAEVEILTPEVDGMLVVHLLPEDTSMLETEKYVFDLWIELGGGDRGPVIEVSEFIVKEPVTKF